MNGIFIFIRPTMPQDVEYFFYPSKWDTTKTHLGNWRSSHRRLSESIDYPEIATHLSDSCYERRGLSSLTWVALIVTLWLDTGYFFRFGAHLNQRWHNSLKQITRLICWWKLAQPQTKRMFNKFMFSIYIGWYIYTKCYVYANRSK